MKSVTEFPNLKLAEGMKAKAALAAEGKSPEEIEAAIGEQFKFEGEKLKYFVNAVDVAGKSSEKLYRVQIVKLNEGQNPPPGATLIDDFCYIAQAMPNSAKKAAPAAAPANAKGGRGGGRPGGGGGKGGGGKPKESPWGYSPEEKEAKLAAARQAAREKSLAAKK